MTGRRIVWHSVVPWAPSGYGVTSAAVITRLLDRGFDVRVTADAGLAVGSAAWRGIDVHAAPFDRPRSLVGWLDRWSFGGDDVLVTFVDLFRLSNEPLAGRPVLSWTPVQTDPLEATSIDHLRNTGSRPVAMSRFGAAALAGAGFDAPYVPLGIDRSVIGPLVPGDRAASRAAARAALGIDPEEFLIGVVATNTQAHHNRKSLPEIFAAVGGFAAEHPNVGLYVHAPRYAHQQDGQHLDPLLQATIGDRAVVRFTDPARYDQGLTTDEMVLRYNAFDVLCAPSASEGFCLPLIEAQACGVPVIASDWSAQPENVGAGWLVEVQPRWNPAEARWWATPSIDGIRRALESALADGDRHADRAIAFAADFDIDDVVDRWWVPLLAGDQADPPGPGPVPT